MLEHISAMSGYVLAVDLKVSLSSCSVEVSTAHMLAVEVSLSSCPMDSVQTGPSDVSLIGVSGLWNASDSEVSNGLVDVHSNVTVWSPYSSLPVLFPSGS